MSSDVRAWTGTAFRLVLSGILFWSGLAKLLESNDARREAILAYRVFPPSWIDFLGWALPAFEVGLAALLLVGLFTRFAALATALLMLGFIVGISSVWIRGYSIDCGCFGGGGNVGEEGKVWRYTSELLRDFLFMGMAVWLVAWPRTRFALDRPPFEPDDDYDDDTEDENETLEEQSR
ncbi:MAG TPA: MauE/DoxX family redox-associated membrane protein [Candidatus Angelobacter sp.]|nr:MauE/DoxX family redox-associated membrane protein [Candidatus Angelobacter sp.]